MFNSKLFTRKDIPADYGKMPDSYDFSTKGFDIKINNLIRYRLERIQKRLYSKNRCSVGKRGLT